MEAEPALSAPADLANRFACVTDVVLKRLEVFANLLCEWQATHNLVGPDALRTLWPRHIEDSLQLADMAGPARHWVDLGSGAGFPGLIVAIARAGEPDFRVTLVESNRKKSAFLRAAIRATDAPARVFAGRIENYESDQTNQLDVISARALAPFADLCRLVFPLMRAETRLILLKGQDFVHEEQVAAKSWSYDLVTSPSVT
ncbi:MAG TPA: 16S rRNA (guanine(527)-N(7))-methyltransferase RsmG, partial [Afifellaceae bacterium]|nr:16S rRNA (guanine(527)-N(7))-methyltransferase RsmG [Afifellaceae bacterium]